MPGRSSFADDFGHEMVDGAVTLQFAELAHFDRTVLADPAQVVAEQIDDHDVLGPVFGAGKQSVAIGLIFLRRAASAGRVPLIGRVSTAPVGASFRKALPATRWQWRKSPRSK